MRSTKSEKSLSLSKENYRFSWGTVYYFSSLVWTVGQSRGKRFIWQAQFLNHFLCQYYSNTHTKKLNNKELNITLICTSIVKYQLQFLTVTVYYWFFSQIHFEVACEEQTFLLAHRRRGAFCGMWNVCDSATEILYWWRKICLESGQKR